MSALSWRLAGCRSLLLASLLAVAADASARGWEPAWSATLEAVPGRSMLRGACVRGETLYVAAVVASKVLTEATPVLYALPLGAPPAAGAKRLWQGGTVIAAENGMSNPLCGPEGVTFFVREAGKAATELVRVSEAGRVTRRKLANVPLVDLTAVRPLDAGQWLLAARPPARLFVAREDGQTQELPVPDLAEDENALDACVSGPDHDVVLLSSAQFDQPVGLLKLRKWSAGFKLDAVRDFRGSFAGLACSPDGSEVEVFHVQPQGGGAGSWVVARFNAGLSGPKTQVVDVAAIPSLSASGLWRDGSVDWAVTNYKTASVYEVRPAGGGLAWRDVDPRFGATTNPPSLAVIDEGSVAVVYEAYDRSVEGLPVVLRAARLKK